MNERLRIAGALKPLPLYIKTMLKHHITQMGFPFYMRFLIVDRVIRRKHKTGAKADKYVRTAKCVCLCAGIQADQMLGKIVSVTSIRCNVANRIRSIRSTTIYRCYFHVMRSRFFLFLLLSLHAYHKNYARWWQKTSLVTPFDSNKVSQQLRSVIITAKAQRIVQLHVNKCTWCT